MKIKKSKLKSALATVGAAQGKATLKILECVHIAPSDKGGVDVTASNLDLTVTAWIPPDDCEGCIETPLCVDHRRLSQIVGAMDGAEVVVTSDGKNAVVTDGRAMYRLPVSDAADFPARKEIATEAFTLPLKEFTASLGAVSHAANSDGTRRVLQAVFFERCPEGVFIVAADGRRLARRRIEGKGDGGGVVIPLKSVASIASLGAGASSEEQLTVKFDAMSAQFSARGVTVTTSLVAEVYPLYRQVIPTASTDDTVELDRAEILAALRRASICTGLTRSTRFKFAKNELLITGQSEGEGAYREAIPIKWEAPPAECSLDCKFFADAISNADGETVEFLWRGKFNAIEIRAGAHQEIVMPLTA